MLCITWKGSGAPVSNKKSHCTPNITVCARHTYLYLVHTFYICLELNVCCMLVTVADFTAQLPLTTLEEDTF